MLTGRLMTFLLIFTISDGRILIYNTENDETFEKFDCIYYVNGDGEETPYCQRLNDTRPLDRKTTMCKNEGEKILLRHLIDRDVKPSEVLQWSSSIEIADIYARVFYNHSFLEKDGEKFICNCTASGTFGKYCEYQLTHGKRYFSEAVKAQFEGKKSLDTWNTQRYGTILCYETLPCNTGDLCLDWREICDGVQRCSDGIDEENWDKLEFNECEDDQFRCRNGMCIAEEFWLDGEYLEA
jgi:hypothetical protein